MRHRRHRWQQQIAAGGDACDEAGRGGASDQDDEAVHGKNVALVMLLALECVSERSRARPDSRAPLPLHDTLETRNYPPPQRFVVKVTRSNAVTPLVFTARTRAVRIFSSP